MLTQLLYLCCILLQFPSLSLSKLVAHTKEHKLRLILLKLVCGLVFTPMKIHCEH